jgi:hypothetical protein
LAVVLPPGAFFGLAALLALRNAWTQRAADARRLVAARSEQATSE